MNGIINGFFNAAKFWRKLEKDSIDLNSWKTLYCTLQTLYGIDYGFQMRTKSQASLTYPSQF